jgi:DNA polymerase-1
MLMDGHALVHRAWHAISVRQHFSVRTTGEDVTAVYGFVNSFFRALQTWRPTHCAIAFDLPVPTFRHRRFKPYKAQRPPAPPELVPQFDRVRQFMEALQIPIFEVEGYEADDVLGTLCHIAEQKGVETVILTGDTDTLQLVTPLVRVALQYRVQEQRVFDEAEVKARYGGLAPSQQADLKALKGDPSDNIPGVPGVGEKTAIKLLLEYGSMEGIYENIQAIRPASLQKKLAENREQAFLGKELTTIVNDLPLDLDLETSSFGHFRREDVIGLFRELEFFSLTSKLPEPLQEARAEREGMAARPQATADYKALADEGELDDLLQALSRSGGFTLDVETTSLDPMQADLVGLSFSIAPGHGRYVPVGHTLDRNLPLETVLAKLKPVLEDGGIPKTAHNGNYDLTVLANYGIQVKNLAFDTMVAAHLTGRKAVGLKALALDILNEEMTPITDLIGKGRKQVTMAQVPLADAMPYACADADMTGRLKEVLEEELRAQALSDLFAKVEMPLVPVLVAMQRNGIVLDVASLRQMSSEMQGEIERLESDIYGLVGHEFRINSPQQLSEVLFNEIRLPKTRRTTTGYATDAGSLENLRGVHPIIDKLLEYRQLTKLKSTYLDSLPILVNPRTGRVHTSYNQTGTTTGRISSSDPNLQNIPIRTELGRTVRKAFVAEGAPDWLLLSADYSQIELRVLAHLSQDEGLLAAFRRGEDIHAATGAMMFEVPIDQVTPGMRRIAKILNFGVIYGLSAYGISQQTEFSPEEGQRFIDSYFTKYPGIQAYLERTKEQVRAQGYVETVLGRRRYIPEIDSRSFQARQAAERMAVNMPVQGTAADIMKLAMIRVHERLANDRLKARMLLQVHDELVFELPKEEQPALTWLLQEEMGGAMEFSVPLKVDIKTGYTWGEME